VAGSESGGMSVTPEFNWPLIEPTDFVTNLPADFELFADAVDDDLKGLKGGSSGQVLAKNSNTDLDFIWQTPGAPSFTGCMLYKGASQTLSNNTFTAVTFAAADYIDTDNFHDPSTNNTRITIPAGKGGKYLVFGNVCHDAGAANNYVTTRIYLNGSEFAETFELLEQAQQTADIQAIMNLSAGDYIELYAYQLTGGSNPIYGETALAVKATCFGVQLLGA
jgi:hypothetical protein